MCARVRWVNVVAAVGWGVVTGGMTGSMGCRRRGDVLVRPVAPLSTAFVSSQRPVLRWKKLGQVDEVTVEICRDRAMSRECKRMFARGERAVPDSALSPGVWFWRVRAQGGSRDGFAGPVWQFTVGARSAAVQSSWGTVLDVNGDGYADMLVAIDQAQQEGEERVEVHLGSASGLRTSSSVTLRGERSSSGVGAGFGASVASAGDVNGDGYADVVIGAPWADRVYVYFGSERGLNGRPAMVLQGPERRSKFGASVASAGDVNGDGYADVVVGAPEARGEWGRVYVYLGGPRGIERLPVIELEPVGSERGRFGFSLAGAVDINGDGHADVVVGAPMSHDGNGRVYVFSGTANGLNRQPMAILEMYYGREFGWRVENAGDVNGDGYTDVVIRDDGMQLGAVYFGSPEGLKNTSTRTLDRQQNELAAEMPEVSRQWGAVHGDIDGDGCTDVPVAVSWSVGNEREERLRVLYGSCTERAAMSTVVLPFRRRESVRYSLDGIARWGVTSAGDVNGDGYADVMVQVTEGDGAIRTVYVYHGSAEGLRDGPAAVLTYRNK